MTDNETAAPPVPAPSVGPTEPPDDVMEWVRETYYPDGVTLWLRSWRNGDAAHRAHMEAVARIPSGGT